MEQQVIIPIDMEFSTQGHREVDHFQTFWDDDGFPLETCKPMTIGRMMALNPSCLSFAHDQPSFRNDGTIDLIFISTIYLHIPLL